MRHLLAVLSIATCASGVSLLADQLVVRRVESLPHREFAHQPMPRYQAGHLFSRNQALSSIWVDSIDDIGETLVERALTLPDSFQVSVADVAVSFDGEVAVSADAMDREGRLVSVIAWLDSGGSATHVVRTSPFAATGIGFTADGSLWAVGIEKISRSEAHPSHAVVRQYSSDGVLVRTLLSRDEFPSDPWHPAYGSFLATSRNYIAFVSREARTHTLISSAGVILRHGKIDIPSSFRIVSGAVTDSGRVFINGHWPDDTNLTMFEITGSPVKIGSEKASSSQEIGYLVGSDGEEVVYYSGRLSKFVWAGVN